MATYDYDMIVLGAGAAGLTVTAGAARLGVRVLLVEREPLLGGDCLHHGCVPSKTLIKSARVYHQMRTAERWGLPHHAPAPVDFRAVAEHIRAVQERIQPHDSPERFRSLGAEVAFGEASFVDEHTIRIHSSTERRLVSARQFVIATGSSPALPPIPGLAEADVLTNLQIFTLERLPSSMVVLGGGPIAMEMAQAFQRLGTQVTVVQRSGQILSREDKDMADLVQEAMEREGVRFLLDTTIREVRTIPNSGVEVDVVTRNGMDTTVTAERVLVAMGRTPNVASLHLSQAGVHHSPKGIAVDARMRTNRTHIFACGDVTGQYQFTHAAGYEGGIVIANAVFGLPRKADYTWLPWVTYTDPELASIGLNEQAALLKGIAHTVHVERFSGNDRALAEGEAEGCLKMVLDAKKRILGVQIAGPHAGELINEWVAVLGGGVRLSTLAGAVHPYPTLGEISKRAAGSLVGERLFSDGVRRILRLVYGYRGTGS